MAWSAQTTQLQLAALVVLTVVSVDAIRRLIRDRIERKGYPLPPGPTPLPVLGSILSVDTEEPFRTYTEWRDKYGDIMYTRLLDMDVVVLNSPTTATDLLEKRSQIYSDRPYIATVDSYGHNFDFAFMRYGEHWRLCRRIFHQTFRAEAAAKFHPIQLRKAREMIMSLMDDPDLYESHYSTFSAAVTMCSIYGYDPSPRNDPIVSLAKNFLDSSASALLPEKAVLLKAFPFLLHIPDWLPGSWIKHEAKVARDLGADTVEIPYRHVQKLMETDQEVSPSMVSDHMIRMEKFDESCRPPYEKALKHASATAFMGSVETTTAVLTAFTLAMVQNPHVWQRAQADIDAIVGTNRLPGFNDRPSLPYIDAIVRETLRWQPPAPLGGPHATTTSDIYNGFYIPKGATVFGNVWAMSRDEVRYPNAEQFIPERFLDAEGMLIDNTPDFVFGFGRRICPGRHAARSSLWSVMVTMLATLDFNLAKDANGDDIMFQPKFQHGIVRHVLSFPCRIIPRTHISKAFLEQALTR